MTTYEKVPLTPYMMNQARPLTCSLTKKGHYEKIENHVTLINWIL